MWVQIMRSALRNINKKLKEANESQRKINSQKTRLEKGFKK